MRAAELSPFHYASRWPVPDEENFNDRKAVNDLGIAYAKAKDPARKQEIQLEILKCFHGYMLKYLRMIVTGSLSSLKYAPGQEAFVFLKTLLRKGSTGSRMELLAVCRTLHLAFKQMTADEIYDALVLCMISALNKYDPGYTDKVKQVCEAISVHRPKRSKAADFSIETLSKSVGFDTTLFLRLLASKQYLVSVAGPKKKIIGYKRGPAWPPPESFFSSGPIGCVYFLPRYFRYYLHDYISKEMASIESKEDVLQLEHARTSSLQDAGYSLDGWTLPHAEGLLRSESGTYLKADTTLMEDQFDVSRLDLAWVEKTADPLFVHLDKEERYLLYLVFGKGLPWVQVAVVLERKVPEVRKMYQQIMQKIRDRAKI